MIKSLIQINNPLKYKEEWLIYLYNTKEKKYNVLNVYSLKEINNHSVFNYVKRSLEILDNINNKNKLDKQTLYLVEETLKWQDVSKTGNKKIRKIWKEKGYNLYCHNIGSSQIYSVHNNDEIVKVLIKTHGLIGQYIKGEINLDKNIELYNLIRDNKLSSSKLKEVLLILNECIISAISKTLYDSVSNEIEVVINKIINNTFEENINYLDKLNRLNNGINKIDVDYLKSLPNNIGEILNNLFKKLEIWYYEGALNDFSIEEQVKILLLINNNINKKISNLSFESLMNSLYLDYKDKKEINIYKKRIIESYLNNISLEDIIGNNIAPNPHISYKIIKFNDTLEFNFKFSIQAKKLIEFCEVSLTSDIIYQKATYMLYDLFGFRRDSYDRFYNELSYLSTMNKSKDKAIILDYITGKKVLDVGPGGGVMLDLIESTNKNYDIWGIDLSSNVIEKLNEKKLKENHSWNIIKGDALNLTNYFELNSIDTIIYSSIIHELYSYIEYNGKKFNKDTIRQTLQESWKILKPKGRIIIRDGIKTEPIETYRIIKFNNPEDINILKRYCKDFKGRNITFEQISNDKVRMLVNDAMEFLYTYTWGEQSYPLEVQEQFGYFTLNEYIKFIKDNLDNCKIIKYTSFLQKGYEDNLLNKISIYDNEGNIVKLPDSTSLIVIEKL